MSTVEPEHVLLKINVFAWFYNNNNIEKKFACRGGFVSNLKSTQYRIEFWPLPNYLMLPHLTLSRYASKIAPVNVRPLTGLYYFVPMTLTPMSQGDEWWRWTAMKTLRSLSDSLVKQSIPLHHHSVIITQSFIDLPSSRLPVGDWENKRRSLPRSRLTHSTHSEDIWILFLHARRNHTTPD